MRNVDDVMRLGELAFEKATEEARALDAQFLANLESAPDIARLTICHAMALFVLRSAKDGYIATDSEAALKNGLMPIELVQVPFHETLPEIISTLRAAAEMFEHLNSRPQPPKPGEKAN
jgi:hypothetical protein